MSQKPFGHRRYCPRSSASPRGVAKPPNDHHQVDPRFVRDPRRHIRRLR
jgi:hypothetical protein